MKRNTALLLVGAATAAGAIGALAIKRDGGSELKPSGSRAAEWWATGTEPALWDQGVRSAAALADRHLAALGAAPMLAKLVDYNRTWRNLTSDVTYALMKREAAAPENAAIVKPAIAAVDRHRAYSLELQRFAFFMPDAMPASKSQIDAFTINLRALASALDRGHYALVPPVAADSGSWLPDVDAIDVVSVLNPIVGVTRVSAWALGKAAPVAGGIVGSVAGNLVGGLVGGLGSAAGGLLRSSAGVLLVGGGVAYLIATRGKK